MYKGFYTFGFATREATMPRLAAAAILSTWICFGATECQGRTWTDLNGRTVDAEFVSSEDGKVTVRRTSDGKVFTIPLAKLSVADREFVDSKMGSTNVADTSASSPPAPGSEPRFETPFGYYVETFPSERTTVKTYILTNIMAIVNAQAANQPVGPDTEGASSTTHRLAERERFVIVRFWNRHGPAITCPLMSAEPRKV